MGGDAGPGVVASALLKTLQRHTDVDFILHGDEAVLKKLVDRQPKLKARARIEHASATVSMEDTPSHVLRRGKDTSMWHTVQSVKDGKADVAVSAGNTGALMAVSMFGLGIIEGISRPAIAIIWPTLKGQCVGLDVGANGTVDVAATDGLTGNIALKTAEGTARLMGSYLRQALKSSILSRMGAVIASGALDMLRRKLDPRTLNGGVFLGLNGVVVKSHGGADAVGFASAVGMAIDMARADINARIATDRSAITAESAGARAAEL